MPENKRSQQRYDRRLEIEIALADRKIAAHTKNISLGGVLIESVERPTLGSRVQLRFRVPTQKEVIEVGGAVRWSDAQGFGVQFDGLRARDVWALGKYFEQPA